MFADTSVESLELIQPDTIGASSIVPSPQIETTLKKVLYLLVTEPTNYTRLSKEIFRRSR